MPVFVRKPVLWKACAAVLIGLAVLAPAFAAKSTLPNGMKLPKDVKVPNDTPVAIYLPANDLGSRFYVSSIGAWAYPGKSLDDARSAVGGQLFPQMQPVKLTDSGAFADSARRSRSERASPMSATRCRDCSPTRPTSRAGMSAHARA